MAGIRELGKKAEDLIETGNEAAQEVRDAQSNVVSAQSSVQAARRQLAAASETDEEGKPIGDVAAAQAQLNMAQNMLAASERALESAQRDVERINREKHSAVQEIDGYSKTAKSNIEKLRQLGGRAFGENAAGAIDGIAARQNQAEDAKAALLKSMGLEDSTDRVSGGAGSGGGSRWGGANVSSFDISGSPQSYRGGGGGGGFEGTSGAEGKGISAPLGGALGGVLGGAMSRFADALGKVSGSGGSSPSASADGSPAAINTRYTSREQLSPEVDSCAGDYQTHHFDYNSAIREKRTNARVDRLREIINSHRLPEDTVLFRRASMRDLGKDLANLPLDQLAGRCYQFEGIMSTGSRKMADMVSGSDTVLFEIRAEAGTPALDLTQVPWYQEAMFDSPYCYIESVDTEGYNTTHVVVRVLSSGDGLSRVNDFDSLSSYLDSRYGLTLDDSISNLDINTVKSALSGVESVIREYPDVGTLLRSGVTSNIGVMSCTGDKISFNPLYFNESDTLANACKENSAIHHWVRNASPTSIGVHEAAHAAEWALIQANPAYFTNEARGDAWDRCTEASKIVRIACNNIRDTEHGRGKTATELIGGISTYAKSNDSETMAEAFADVFANGDNARPLSKEIKRISRILMEQYKGGNQDVDN